MTVARTMPPMTAVATRAAHHGMNPTRQP